MEKEKINNIKKMKYVKRFYLIELKIKNFMEKIVQKEI